MINVDTVYQKVLTLSNKEQRGYITPQEFNLLADKAQLEIINDYFHKIKTSHLKPKNYSENSDELEMVREKMGHIRTRQEGIALTIDDNIDKATLQLPTDIYMLATIHTAHEFDTNGEMSYQGGHEVTEVDKPQLLNMLRNPLLRPTKSRPVYIRQDNLFSNNTNVQQITVEVHPGNIDATGVDIEYWVKPEKPNWGYVIVNQKALYNFNTSTNFSLHPSEEEPLVMRILQLAGVTMEKLQLQQSVMVDQQQTKQNQNS